MVDDKIELRLREELRRLEADADADRRLPVLIQHVAALEGTGESGPGLDALEHRATELHRELLARLRELGDVGEVRLLALANAVAVRLTPAQILAAAEHPDVKVVVWDRKDQVTT